MVIRGIEMKVRYIQCMDFMFEDVEILELHSPVEFNKAIEESKVIKIQALDGEIDYVNSNYIMYWG